MVVPPLLITPRPRQGINTEPDCGPMQSSRCQSLNLQRCPCFEGRPTILAQYQMHGYKRAGTSTRLPMTNRPLPTTLG